MQEQPIIEHFKDWTELRLSDSRLIAMFQELGPETSENRMLYVGDDASLDPSFGLVRGGSTAFLDAAKQIRGPEYRWDRPCQDVDLFSLRAPQHAKLIPPKWCQVDIIATPAETVYLFLQQFKGYVPRQCAWDIHGRNCYMSLACYRAIVTDEIFAPPAVLTGLESKYGIGLRGFNCKPFVREL